MPEVRLEKVSKYGWDDHISISSLLIQAWVEGPKNNDLCREFVNANLNLFDLPHTYMIGNDDDEPPEGYEVLGRLERSAVFDGGSGPRFIYDFISYSLFHSNVSVAGLCFARGYDPERLVVYGEIEYTLNEFFDTFTPEESSGLGVS